MLAYGVTTIVTDDPTHADNLWEGEQSPGPRILAAGDLNAATEAGSEHAWFFVKGTGRSCRR